LLSCGSSRNDGDWEQLLADLSAGLDFAYTTAFVLLLLLLLLLCLCRVCIGVSLVCWQLQTGVHSTCACGQNGEQQQELAAAAAAVGCKQQ
jgi:hypothetical protein